MEAITSPARWRQIAMATFDRYVTKRMIECNFVITEDGIDEQDLCNLATQMKCKPGPLKITIANACYRITKEHQSLPISQEEENEVMKAAAKLHLQEISVSLMNFKREFGKVVHELNHKNSGLHTNIDELKAFVGPIHAEVIAEFYAL